MVAQETKMLPKVTLVRSVEVQTQVRNGVTLSRITKMTDIDKKSIVNERRHERVSQGIWSRAFTPSSRTNIE